MKLINLLVEGLITLRKNWLEINWLEQNYLHYYNKKINYYIKLQVYEISRVVSVGDGIAHVYELNKIQAKEMVEFARDVKGMALN